MYMSLSLEELTKAFPRVAAALTVLENEIAIANSQSHTTKIILREILEASKEVKPYAYSSESVTPYYKSKYASFVRDFVIKKFTAAVPKDSTKLWVFNPRKEFRKSQVTMLKIISEGWMWLSNNAANGDEYKALREEITVGKEGTTCIKMGWKCVQAGGRTQIVDADYRKSPWKNKIEYFIENSLNTEKLRIDNIFLDTPDVEYIMALCESVGTILILSISDTHVELINCKGE